MAPDTRRGDAATNAPAPAGAANKKAARDRLGRLDQSIAEIRDRQGDTVPVEAVADVVQSLLESLSGDLGADDLRLYHEVEKLGRYIRAAKAEIAALNPADIREEFLPTAADELDAIVQATEKATGEIMDATEMVEDVVEGLNGDAPDPAAAAQGLQDATTRIYEACSFQDITGQRITKVVRMLKSIETRVDALVAAFDPEGHGAAASGDRQSVQQAGNFGRDRAAAVGDAEGDDALLNGPQSDDGAMQQDDIDALLASFD